MSYSNYKIEIAIINDPTDPGATVAKVVRVNNLDNDDVLTSVVEVKQVGQSTVVVTKRGAFYSRNLKPPRDKSSLISFVSLCFRYKKMDKDDVLRFIALERYRARPTPQRKFLEYCEEYDIQLTKKQLKNMEIIVAGLSGNYWTNRLLDNLEVEIEAK